MGKFPFFKKPKTFVVLLRDAFREFQQNEPLRMAAATAFFATFALPPILIILVEVFGFFGNPRSIRHDLVEQLSTAIDRDTILQISQTLKNVRFLSLGWFMQATGFIFLLFVATTFLAVIKDSLNQIWKIRLKKNNGLSFLLLHRLKSIAVIIFAGLLTFVVLNGDQKSILLEQQSTIRGVGTGFLLQRFIYYLLSTITVIIWIILVFKFLADGRPQWKAAIWGGVLTGVLFNMGKFILHLLLSYNKVHRIYGASSAMVLLLLFVFYSSFIFYYGACFVKLLSANNKQPILPTAHAVRYKLKVVDWGDEKNLTET